MDFVKHEVEFWRLMSKTSSNKDLKKQYDAFYLGLSFKGLSKNQQRDFDYYLESARKEKCYQNHFCVPSKLYYKPKTVEEWYFLWDTHGYGEDLELTQPNISDCEGIKQSKEFVNLTIKMWVEDCIDLPAAFDFKMPMETYPMSWVWNSFKGQLKSTYIKKYGFIPTFIKKNIE